MLAAGKHQEEVFHAKPLLPTAATSPQPEAGGCEQHSLADLCVMALIPGDSLASHGWGVVSSPEGWAAGGRDPSPAPGGEPWGEK